MLERIMQKFNFFYWNSSMRGLWIKRSPYDDPQFMIWNEIIQNQVLQSITKIEVLNVDNTDVFSADANWIWTSVTMYIWHRYTIQYYICIILKHMHV